MSVNLNKTNRAAIVETILRETFKKREDALRAAHSGLAQRAYMACVPAEFVAIVNDNPHEWFTWRSIVDLNIPKAGAGTYRARFPLLKSENVELPGPRPFPHTIRNSSGYSAPDLDLEGPSHADLVADILLQIEQEDALIVERNETRVQLEALVNSVRTLKKLLETAPELEPFIPADVKADVVRNLPAVRVDALMANLVKSGLGA